MITTANYVENTHTHTHTHNKADVAKINNVRKTPLYTQDTQLLSESESL